MKKLNYEGLKSFMRTGLIRVPTKKGLNSVESKEYIFNADMDYINAINHGLKNKYVEINSAVSCDKKLVHIIKYFG